MRLIESTYHTLVYHIPRFFKNIFKFRKSLFRYRNDDYMFVLEILQECLIDLKKGLDSPYPMDLNDDKRLEDIEKCITILKNVTTDNYFERAEFELGVEAPPLKFEVKNNTENGNINAAEIIIEKRNEHDDKIWRSVLCKSTEMEEEEWNELFLILKRMRTWWS
jgi:hypothetical protein